MSKKITKKLPIKPKCRGSTTGRSVIRTPVFALKANAVGTLTLYRYVYKSTISFVFAFWLLLSLLLQGIQLAYANELENPPVPLDPVDQVVQGVIADHVVSIPEPDASQSETINQPPVVADSNIDILPVVTESEVADNSIIIATTTVSGADTSLNQEPVQPQTPISDNTDFIPDSVTDFEIQDANDGETLDESVDEEIDSVVELSDDNSTTTYESVSVVSSDTAFTFNKNECTQLTNGSYYCYQPPADALKDNLFSAQDKDGDLEIYLVRDGTQFQITDNKVDDASPYYDDQSNTIVWHRSLDDRYQIISYDVKSGVETQLTHDTVNNMEPTRQGDFTVWQRWLDNSWNIILYDGMSETQITDTSDHDVAPHIQGSLVIWNRSNPAGDKTIEMYDITSKTFVSVNDPEGLSVDNPRMVLVYDSLHANGDIVTKGYNILTGEFIQLDTLPRQLPDEIPNSESTDEIRAMIQSKPELKSFEKVIQAPPLDGPDSNSTTTNQTPVSTSTTETNDMLLETVTLDLSHEKITTTEVENDLIIESILDQQTIDIIEKDVSNIPDLEVTSFSETLNNNASTTNSG